jgi:Protein of unknown function (DUF2892)
MFSRNEGNRDRDLRMLAGAVLIYLAVFVIPSPLNFAVGAVALVLFATAATGFCPLYRVAGISTCSPKDR